MNNADLLSTLTGDKPVPFTHEFTIDRNITILLIIVIGVWAFKVFFKK